MLLQAICSGIPVPVVIGSNPTILNRQHFDYSAYAASVTATLTTPTTAGNLIVVVVTTGDAPLPTAITDSGGNVYTTALEVNSEARIYAGIYYCLNAASASTISVTQSYTYWGMQVYEVSGATGLDTTGNFTCTYSDLASVSATFTTTHANEVVLGVLANYSNPAFSGESYTDDYPNTAGSTGFWLSATQSSAGSGSLTATTTPVGNYQRPTIVVATFY